MSFWQVDLYKGKRLASIERQNVLRTTFQYPKCKRGFHNEVNKGEMDRWYSEEGTYFTLGTPYGPLSPTRTDT